MARRAGVVLPVLLAYTLSTAASIPAARSVHALATEAYPASLSALRARTFLVIGVQPMGVACPTPTDCYVIGLKVPPSSTTVILATKDGGRSWRSAYTGPPGNPSAQSLERLDGIGCPSRDICYAGGPIIQGGAGGVGGTLVVTRDGGKTWSRRRTPAVSLSRTVCPSEGACYAIAGVSPNTELDWAIVSIIAQGNTLRRLVGDPRQLITALACANARVCYAQQNGRILLSTRDGGKTWRRQNERLGTTPNIVGLACPAVDVCWGLGTPGRGSVGHVLATTDGGKTWRAEYTEKVGDFPLAITCPSVRVCFAVGSYGPGQVLATKDGGKTWKAQTSSQKAISASTYTTLNDIACPTTRACTAVGRDSFGRGHIIGTTDGGVTWRSL